MLVFVINKHGAPLMPCEPSKARKLLNQSKAKIVMYNPFTIQLLYGSSGYTQGTNFSSDLGSKHLGVGIVSDDKVLLKGEVELRQDVRDNLSTRRSLRRARRYRKTRYRKSKFKYKTKRYYCSKRNKWVKKKIISTPGHKKGWLPPSIQSRVDNTFYWIDKFCNLLPNPTISIEVGKFDVQKMLNPDISGETYQQGDTYGYFNTRYFVFARDKYTCQVCNGKNRILQTHHIIYESHGGSDRASNLITVCKDCHTSENHQPGNIFWTWMVEGKKLPTYKETVFMNIIRQRVFHRYPTARIVYGSETTTRRKELGLEKTHYNDAIAITGITTIKKDVTAVLKINQFRKKKRSLHESIPRKGRNKPNTTQRRNAKNTKCYKGFYLNDKVCLYGQVGFISGFTTNAAYIKDISGNYITCPSKTYKQVPLKDIKLVCHNNNWQFHIHKIKKHTPLIPHLKEGDFPA